MEANRENNYLEKEDNGSSRNVKDNKTAEDTLKEIQLRKTHDLYCPKCIHNITKTAKLFENGKDIFPYNKDKFISWFVIVISYKYPFIYLPWLYNSTPVPHDKNSDGLELPQRVVDDMARKRVFEWLWFLFLVVLLLLSIMFLLTSSLILSPPSLLRYTNKFREDVTRIFVHLKSHICDIVENNQIILPSLPPPQPSLPYTKVISSSRHSVPLSLPQSTPQTNSPPHTPLRTDESSTTLIPEIQKITEDVSKICGHMKSHVPDVVKGDKIIPNYLPSTPQSLSQSLPQTLSRTDGSSKTRVPNMQKIPEDISEIYGHLKPHVLDAMKDDKKISHSMPYMESSLPQTPPYTDGSSTTLIPNLQKIPEDVTKIYCHLKSHVLDVVKYDITNLHSLPSMPPSLLQIPPQKIQEDVIEMKLYVRDAVKDDKIILPILPSMILSLPQTSPRNEEIHDMEKFPENIIEISSHLKTQVFDAMKDDRSITHSLCSIPSPTQTPPHTNGDSTTLISGMQEITKDVSEIHGHLKPHVPDVLKEDDKPISPSPTRPPPLSHTKEGLTSLNHDVKIISEDVTMNFSSLKPHVADVVEDNISILHSPSPPLLSLYTNGSLKSLINNPEKNSEDNEEIDGHLERHTPNVVQHNRSNPPSLLPIKNKGGWIPCFKYFSSTISISIISLLLLAIPSLCWLSMYWKKRTTSKSDVANINMSNGEAQDSTNNPVSWTLVENEVIDTKNGSRSKDKKTKFLSYFPVHLKELFLSVYGYNIDKGKKEVETKSTESKIDFAVDGEKPSINVKNEKDTPNFPKWYLDVFAWLFLCIIIAISVFFTSPHQSTPSIPIHLEMPSIFSLSLPSASILLLLPAFAVVLLAILAIKSHFIPIYHKEKADKVVDSQSNETTNEEKSQKIQYHDDQAADLDQAYDKKTNNQKVNPTPQDLPPQEQPSIKTFNKEAHEYEEKETPTETQVEHGLLPYSQPEIQKSVEPRICGNKLEILKSIVYGGLTQSITSLCTITSAAASGASTLNVLAMGIAHLSSGLPLIVHSLQELINEKPRRRTNSDDQKNSEADVEEEEEEDRYVEVLGRREKLRFHKLIVISSFILCGLIPPLVYGLSFRRRSEKRQEYKTLAVYAVSLLCIVLLSVAKAYVSRRREYLKTLIQYTSMAMMASGFSTFMGYFINQWLEKKWFYDESTETPRV